MMVDKDVEHVRLGDYIDITNGFAFKSKQYQDSGIRVLRITNVQKGRIVDENPQFYPSETLKDLKKYYLDEGDILMSLTGNVGRVGVVNTDILPAYLNQRVCKIKPNSDKLFIKYLFHLFNSDKFEKEAINGASGIAQLNMSTKWIEEYKIPLPPLDQQKHIAKVLDKADALRQKNKELLQEYNDLQQAIFIDMFGDPVANPMGWEIKTINSIKTHLSDGPFGSNLKSEHYSNNGVRVIRLQNIGINKFNDNDAVYVKTSHYESVLKKYTCQGGDIVIATMGNPNIRACILPQSIKLAIHKADCFLLKVSEKTINNSYIISLFNSSAFMNIASKHFHGQTRSRISKGQFETIEIPIPSIALQNQFAKIIENIEKQKAKAKESLEYSEELFGALVQGYFG